MMALTPNSSYGNFVWMMSWVSDQTAWWDIWGMHSTISLIWKTLGQRAQLSSVIRWLCWSARYLEKLGDVERALEPFYQMQWGRWGGDYRERFIIIGSLRDHQGYLASHKEHGRTERSLEVQDDNFVWHQVLKFPRQSSRHSTTIGGGIILQIGKSNK